MPRPLSIAAPAGGDDPLATAVNLEVERALLALCLDGRHDGAWSKILEHCDGPTAFYARDHRLLALLIDRQTTLGLPTDAVSVANAAAQQPFRDAIDVLRSMDGVDKIRLRLDDSGDLPDSVLAAIGGHSAVLQVAEAFAPWTGLVSNAKTLDQLHRQRQVIAALSELSTRARAVDGGKHVRAIADAAATNLGRIAGSNRDEESVGLGMAKSAVSHDAAKAAGDLIAASWGVAALDEGCRLVRGALVVLAARPGCGKTSMGLQAAIATRAALGTGDAAAIVSLEMGSEQLARIVVGRQLNIGRQNIERGWLTNDQRLALDAAIIDWRKNDIPVKGHRGKNTGEEIASWIRQAHRRSQGRLHLVVIDYLGLIAGTNPKQSTTDRLGEITRALKLLALDLQVCVMLLCQMNRESVKEKRAPEITDLRDSGNIEQDADAVVFLYSDNPSEHESDVMQVMAKVAKYRGGALQRFGLEFMKARGQRFQAVGGNRPTRGERMTSEPKSDEDHYGSSTPQQEPS